MLILLSLAILIIIALFSIMIGGNLQTIESSVIDVNATSGGSSSNFDFSDLSQAFYIDDIVGAIVIIIIIISLSALLGLRIFSSGLSENSVKMLTLGISYIAIWSMFSVLSYSLIVDIEVFGLIIYIILTLAYVIGIMQKFMEF